MASSIRRAVLFTAEAEPAVIPELDTEMLGSSSIRSSQGTSHEAGLGRRSCERNQRQIDLV